jgi:hypothetical protein
MDEKVEHSFQLLNYVFLAIFTLEAVIKIIALGCSYFKDPWNRFDFVVVIASIIVLGIS